MAKATLRFGHRARLRAGLARRFPSAPAHLSSQARRKKGVHYGKAESDHRSDRYIWRYVKPSTQSLADAIDALD